MKRFLLHEGNLRCGQSLFISQSRLVSSLFGVEGVQCNKKRTYCCNPYQREEKPSQSDDEKYNDKKLKYEQKLTPMQAFFDYKQFLIGGTFGIFGDLLKYREMRKEISYRPFRVASRKEMLFMNGFRFDFVKLLIPASCIFMYPKLLLVYLPMCYYYPSIRPSYYQSDSLKKAIRENSHQMRKEQRDVIIQEVLRLTSNIHTMNYGQQDTRVNEEISVLLSVIQKINALKTHNLPVHLLPNLDSLLKDLKQLDQSELFNNHLTIDKYSDNVIDSLCRFSFVARLIFNGISGVFKLTSSGSIVGSRSGGLESNIHSIKYMIKHLFMGASASNTSAIRSVVTLNYKRKMLRYYLNLIRQDDHFIQQVIDTMSLKEMIEGSYVRGFVHDWKFKANKEEELKLNHREIIERYFKLWCEFSSTVQNDNLLLLTTVLLFIH